MPVRPTPVSRRDGDTRADGASTGKQQRRSTSHSTCPRWTKIVTAVRVAGEERRCTNRAWDAAERIEARARHPDGRDRPEAVVVEAIARDVKVITDHTATQR